MLLHTSSSSGLSNLHRSRRHSRAAAATPVTTRLLQAIERSSSSRQEQAKITVAAASSVKGQHAAVDAALSPGDHGKRQYTCALLFDCDGVIVETEELHRMAYNAAFVDFGLVIDNEPVVWTTEYYDILQNTVGGGKPKMKYHFNKFGWPASKYGPVPESDEEKNRLVDELQDCKTGHYTQIVEQAADARPGVLALMDEGLARPDVAMAICSAATKEGFVKVVESVVGLERLAKFDVILAGDDVTRKKPDPLIYNMARERLGGIPASRCCVIEDSLVGLRAAVGAGMHCIITPTTSTASADFCGEGAAAVVPTLGGDNYQVTINDIFGRIADEQGQPLQPSGAQHPGGAHDNHIPWQAGSWSS